MSANSIFCLSPTVTSTWQTTLFSPTFNWRTKFKRYLQSLARFVSAISSKHVIEFEVGEQISIKHLNSFNPNFVTSKLGFNTQKWKSSDREFLYHPFTRRFEAFTNKGFRDMFANLPFAVFFFARNT